ncbi:glycerate kinase [Curtobacterium sp. MCBD17_028]|nr:glycerate kinase [Curtobacterium sp. MCBD17_028]
MMRVLVAPDAFKGTASAASIARALAHGWRAERPGDVLDLAPMADGGEGTIDAFATAFPDAERVPVVVRGPDDRPVHAEWLRLPDGRGLVELASTSGITLLDHPRPDAAHTHGFGAAIAAALGAGARGVVLAIGGSASTDGGLGVLRELGLRLRPPLGPDDTGGAALDRIEAVDRATLRPTPEGVRILTDVTAPLLGPRGAAAVFGPQKGITPDRVPVHESRLRRWASMFPDVDPDTPGAGAAGGTGFGLLAWGGTIALGGEAVAEVLDLADSVLHADLVVTGEGRFDGQTAGGKVVAVVQALAAAARRPVALVAGEIAVDPRGFAHAVALTDLTDRASAMRGALAWSRTAGARLAVAASAA